MSTKIYQIINQFCSSSSTRIDVNGKSKVISFESKRKNGLLTFETNNTDIQEAIEKLERFKNGTITCISGFTAPATTKAGKAKKEVPTTTDTEGETKLEDEPNQEGETKQEEKTVTEFPEVTEWQQAKEMLRAEPYKVAFQQLNSPANILKNAKALGITFPNLKE